MLSDIDGDCQCHSVSDSVSDSVNSNWPALSVTLRLIFILVLQVRESGSSQRSQE